MERFGPSILVEAGDTSILVDVGRGAIQRLFQIGQGAQIRAVDMVLFTHLHSDHVVGFPDFWVSGWIFGRSRPLPVTGPPGTEEGTIFSRVRPRLAVYSHIVPSPATAEDLIPPTRRTYDGPLVVGYDLMKITIGETIEVHRRRIVSDR